MSCAHDWRQLVELYHECNSATTQIGENGVKFYCTKCLELRYISPAKIKLTRS